MPAFELAFFFSYIKQIVCVRFYNNEGENEVSCHKFNNQISKKSEEGIMYKRNFYFLEHYKYYAY